MKRFIALALTCALLLSGCGSTTSSQDATTISSTNSASTEKSVTASSNVQQSSEDESVSPLLSTDIDPEKVIAAEDSIVADKNLNLNDEELESYLENKIYSELITNLDSSEYVVESVDVQYLSKEYIEQLAYNSQENIYFGYTQSELDEQFQGKKYVFTLADDGTTTVQEVEEYSDGTANQVLKNVAIGAGVILVCVTVSAVTGGLGTAPAVSLIFAAGAKTGTVMALSGGAIGGISAGVIKGYQTGNFEDAKKAALLGASEGFKWGAISGALSGGATEFASLKAMTENGLTMNEVATIQSESHYPPDVIKQMKSMDEYHIYKEANLRYQMVDGRSALVRDIDLNFKSTLPDGTEVTNLQRMQQGYAPMYKDATGQLKAYQLHHVNQDAKGTLAILKEAEHQPNANILNTPGKAKDISDAAWSAQRKSFWTDLGNQYAAALGL